MGGESKEVVLAYCGLVCSECGALFKDRTDLNRARNFASRYLTTKKRG